MPRGKRKLLHVEGQQSLCLFGVKREASASDAGKVHDLVTSASEGASGLGSASPKATAAVAASAAVAESARAEASAADAAEAASAHVASSASAAQQTSVEPKAASVSVAESVVASKAASVPDASPGVQGAFHGGAPQSPPRALHSPPPPPPSTACKSKSTYHFDCKTEQNAFNYRIAKAPQARKERWEALKSCQGAEQEAFVQDILAVQKGDYSNVLHTLQRTTEVTDTTVVDDQSGWISYQAFEGIEGAAQALVMVRAKTVETRDHPKIPPNMGIEWPHNQQVWHEDTKNHKRKEVTDQQRSINEVEADPTSAHRFADAAAQLRGKMGKGSVATAPVAPPAQGKAGVIPKGKPEISQQDKVAIENMKKTHSEWDRKRREYKGTLTASSLNPNTRDTKFHTDLQQYVADGTAIDDNILEYETKFKINQQFTTQDLRDLAARCTDLVAKIKKANELQNALKMWLNVSAGIQ